MRSFYVLVLVLFLSGCVASTEVKQASAQVGVALDQLQNAQVSFRKVYVGELEEVRELAGRAIVADAVVQKVGTLKQQEIDGDLIEISKAISHERETYRRIVAEVLAVKPKPNETDEDAVIQILAPKRVAALRASADALEELGLTESAGELKRKADELDTRPSSLERDRQFSDLVVLVTLAGTQQDVKTALKDLEDYIQFLRLIHSGVNEWIVTDVTVKGTDVANLISKVEKLQQ